jgi:CrcB protein
MSMTPDHDPRTPGPLRPWQRWRLRAPDTQWPIDPDLAPDDPAEPSAQHRPSAIHAHRRDPRVLALIAAGGFIGASARYGLDRAWPVRPDGFPWTTFVINASGAFALGVMLTFILQRRASGRYLRPFACVGILGAWTTMSTLATESDVLVKDGHAALALGYVVASLIVGVCATAAGIAVTRRRESVR